MAPSSKFLSFAQNGEDVVLHRALQHIESGTYVDVGANHPIRDSISWSMYSRGWSGLLVEPFDQFADQLERTRPRDKVERVVAGAKAGVTVLHTIEGTGLSTVVDEVATDHRDAGKIVTDLGIKQEALSTLLTRNDFDDRPIHFMSIDTEGYEREVLLGINFALHRPWILVIEATAPTSTRQVHQAWESLVLAAGYEFCLFDGLSRFYVAREHSSQLRSLLSYPACVFDEFERFEDRLAVDAAEAHLTVREHELEVKVRELEVTRSELEMTTGELERSQSELRAMRSTISWRITAGFRRVRPTILGRFAGTARRN